MSTDIALPEASILGRIRAATSSEQRAALQALSMERIVDPRFAKPVPRFLTELPYGGDDDEITDRIAAAVLVAEDPDKAQAETGTTATRDIIGKPVTVWDLRVLDGEIEGSWGAYLLLDVTVGDDPAHIVVNTSSKQIITRLARCWAEGQIPVRGAFAEIEGTGKRGSKALAFISEPAF